MARTTGTTLLSAKLKPLAFLIGRWHTSGTILTAESDNKSTIRGMDTYEWISGGQFILHRVDVFMGTTRTEVNEVIGYDQKEKKYFMTSYDNTGAVATMYATLERNGVFKLGDKKMRATLSINNKSLLTARWESYNKGWKPWMELTLKK